MPRLSHLSFSKKIFLAIFATAVVSNLIICIVLYQALKSYRSKDFAESYVDHMKLLGKSLLRVEQSQAHISLNAAKYIQTLDQKNAGQFSGTDLQDLKKELGVEGIHIFDRAGKLVSPKNESWTLEYPGFDINSEKLYQSSLIKVKDQVSQYTLLPSFDKKRWIVISTSFKGVTEILKEMVIHDDDNLAVALYSATGEALGAIQRIGYEAKPIDLNIFNNTDGIVWAKDEIYIKTDLQGVGRQSSYRFITTISTEFLQGEIQKIRNILLGAFTALILIAWILSNMIVAKLLARIQTMRLLLGNITRTQDYSERLNVVDPTSKDEIEDLAVNMNLMLQTLQQNQAQKLVAERDKARSQVAAQVAHDIRSPLMSMNMALAQLEGVTLEPLALIKSAVSRVAGIVQKLSIAANPVEEAESTTETPKLTLIEPLIASVINEHKVRRNEGALQLNGLPAKPQTWTVIQVAEVQSAISNLINNAFEAGATKVEVEFSELPKQWQLSIKDNGSGIPADILPKIFEREFTHGKKTGTGLGLYQAKAAIEWSGGQLQVQTVIGQGTTFVISIPKEKKPSWISESLQVDVEQSVYIVDDDQNILQSWRSVLEAATVQKFKLFNSVEQLEAEISLAQWPVDAILIIDQNLGGLRKGLEVLQELKIEKRGFLCTSDFDEKRIQDGIRKLNGNLIPKFWVSQFDLKVRN